LRDLPDDGFLVHPIVECLSHTLIIKRFEMRVEPDEEQAKRWPSEDLILPVLGIVLDLFCLPAGDDRLI
jgi:hypothetical protein